MVPTLKKEMYYWIKLILVLVLILTPIHFYGFNITLLHGQSMEPSLHDGQRIFVNRAIYIFTTPKIQDIVILKEPQFTSFKDPLLAKRVVAVAGDTIEVFNGKLYRNGKKINEKYTDAFIQDGNYGPEKVAADHVFVLGDNRHLWKSKDSRHFGQVPLDLIVGRAEFIVWPLQQAGGLY